MVLRRTCTQYNIVIGLPSVSPATEQICMGITSYHLQERTIRVAPPRWLRELDLGRVTRVGVLAEVAPV